MTWIRKKIGPGVSNITTADEAEHVLTSESKAVLGFLESLVVHTSLHLFSPVISFNCFSCLYWGGDVDDNYV